jgi:putative lipoprotein (rSAM/lipoprotein system)
MRKLIYLLFGGILTALGFSGCDGGIGKAEYGTPHCDFKNDITVTDESGNPIKGIRVTTVKTDNSVDSDLVRDTLYTDENGKVGKQYELFSAPDKYELKFEDVDEEENGGSFETATETFEVKQTKKGDGDWYDGAYEATGTKSLKKAE